MAEDPAILAEHVDNGALFMDRKFGTDWPWEVDPYTLVMQFGCRCVLGQHPRFCGYRNALNELGLTEDEAVRYGFNLNSRYASQVARTYEELTQLWREKILALRRLRPRDHAAAS